MVMFSFPESSIDILNGARLVFVCNQLRFFGVFCQDYMGKLEARKSHQGTSENLGCKISLHGSLFIMKNPPQHIRDLHSDSVDWSKFPSAEDDCLVQVNVYGGSDNSKQSANHMGNVMSVQYKELKKSFPWITAAIPFSDQCGDYRSTPATIFNHEMGRLTGVRVKLVIHAEVGEGKGEMDMRFGQKSQQFVPILGRSSRTCAEELFGHLELCRGPGDYNFELAIPLPPEKDGSSALPYLEQSSAVAFASAGGATLREVDGYGPGILVTKETLATHDHMGTMALEETGAFAVQQSPDGMIPQRREHAATKQELNTTRAKKKSERQMLREASMVKRNDRLKAVVSDHLTYRSQFHNCSDCGSRYRSDASYERHITDGTCYTRKRRLEAKRAGIAEREPALSIVKKRREERKTASDLAIQENDTVTYVFELREDTNAVSFGCGNDESKITVTSVLHSRQMLATRILPDYTILRVNDDETNGLHLSVDKLKECLDNACAGRPVSVTFLKPTPPMPLRGFARKRPRKERKSRVTREQSSFLQAFCNLHEETRTPPRAKTVRDAMMRKYGRFKLDENSTRILMDEDAIFNWLKRRWAAKKVATTIAAAVAVIEASEKNDTC